MCPATRMSYICCREPTWSSIKPSLTISHISQSHISGPSRISVVAFLRITCKEDIIFCTFPQLCAPWHLVIQQFLKLLPPLLDLSSSPDGSPYRTALRPSKLLWTRKSGQSLLQAAQQCRWDGRLTACGGDLAFLGGMFLG